MPRLRARAQRRASRRARVPPQPVWRRAVGRSGGGPSARRLRARHVLLSPCSRLLNRLPPAACVRRLAPIASGHRQRAVIVHAHLRGCVPTACAQRQRQPRACMVSLQRASCSSRADRPSASPNADARDVRVSTNAQSSFAHTHRRRGNLCTFWQRARIIQRTTPACVRIA